MIFKLKDNTHLLGTHKTEQRFAWLPTRVKYDLVWMQRFIEIYQYDRDPNNYYKFKWVLIERMLCYEW